MGHGDEIVLADGNFPAESLNSRVIRLDAHGGAEVLKAVVSVLPLDTYAESNAILMEKVPGDDVETPIWDEYEKYSSPPKATRLKRRTWKGSLFTNAQNAPTPLSLRAKPRFTQTLF